MPDSNTTQILIDNADRIFPYFLVVIVALIIMLILFRESVFKKYAKGYFDEEVTKELNNYKKEFFTLLNDRKIANKFKEEPVLILNDSEGLIQKYAFNANYVHQVLATLKDDAKDMHLYKFTLLYVPTSDADESQKIYDEYVDKFLSKLNHESSIVYIYHEGFIKEKHLGKIPKHSVMVNSQLTLVERLENAFVIKKVMGY